MLNLVGPVIPVATEPEGDPASYQADARRQLDELRQFTEEQKFAQKQATTEIEQTLSGVRKAAGQVGVSTHKRLFEIEANKQERVSQAWLNWTAGFAAITLGYAIAAAIGPAGFLALPTESDVAASRPACSREDSHLYGPDLGRDLDWPKLPCPSTQFGGQSPSSDRTR